MKKGSIKIQTAKMENKTTHRAKMSNKRSKKQNCSTSSVGYKASEATSRAACFAQI